MCDKLQKDNVSIVRDGNLISFVLRNGENSPLWTIKANEDSLTEFIGKEHACLGVTCEVGDAEPILITRHFDEILISARGFGVLTKTYAHELSHIFVGL